MEQKQILKQIPLETMLIIAKNYDTVDEARICEIYMRMQNQKYLDCHNHNIWQGKNGVWYTYLDDENSKRGYVLKTRTSQTGIEDLVIDFYKKKEEDPTLEEMFEIWINRKKENKEVKPQTVNKYRSNYKRFFDGTVINKMRVRKITEDDLDSFIRRAICEGELTNKAYSSMRILIRGIFKMAKLKKFTQISISTFFNDIDLPSSIFKRTVRNNKKEVFWTHEIPLIKEYLDKSENVFDWGVALTFETGMRVGETSALKNSDFSPKYVHVQRTEVHYYDEDLGKSVREVQEMAKTDAGNRHIILTDKARELYERVRGENPNGEFLFEFNGRRLSYNRFNKRLKKACDNLGFTSRTMHKIRKTYGTTLLNNNVPESLVAEMIGHADISTTKKFYYIENQEDDTKIEAIQRALM
ncbi:integrase [Lachnospiraceae bacterium PF1-21]